MTRRIEQHQLVADQEIVEAPALAPRACTDRTFELPPILHIATALLFMGFVSVLCAVFATPGLLIPYAVFVIFIAAFFAVPGLWARMKPVERRTKALSWDEFLANGVDTMTGRTPAIEATSLVLVLPTLIFG